LVQLMQVPLRRVFPPSFKPAGERMPLNDESGVFCRQFADQDSDGAIYLRELFDIFILDDRPLFPEQAAKQITIALLCTRRFQEHGVKCMMATAFDPQDKDACWFWHTLLMDPPALIYQSS